MCCLVTGTEQTLFYLLFSPVYGNQQNKPSAESNCTPGQGWLQEGMELGQTLEEPAEAAAVPQCYTHPTMWTKRSTRAEQNSSVLRPQHQQFRGSFFRLGLV